MEKRLEDLEAEIRKLRAEREIAEKGLEKYPLISHKALLKVLSRDNLALKAEIQGLVHKDQGSIVCELVGKTAALAEVFSTQSLLLSQCTQEAAVSKLETLDLAETLKAISQEIEKRHKGKGERSGSVETKCEDSRPTLDCSFDQRASWGDAKSLVGEIGDKQGELSFVIMEEEEQITPEQPLRLETDTSLVDSLLAVETSGITVVHTEPAPLSPAKTPLSRLARGKKKESTAIEQSFKRRSSTLWRL